jgi:hypothetical protein
MRGLWIDRSSYIFQVSQKMQYTSISYFVSSEPSTKGTKAFHFWRVFGWKGMKAKSLM